MLTAVFRLIRLPNLLMVALTMYLMRWSIVRPILDYLGMDPEMPEWSFAILVFSTLMITAAGNVINDFHDVRADQINHPQKVVIDRAVSRRKAIFAHFMLNVSGIITGIFVAFYHHTYWLSFIFIIVPGLLWWYSIKLKHIPIWGNITVSVLTATVPLLVILFEYPLQVKTHAVAVANGEISFMPIVYWVSTFAIFAFLTNLIREMVKDGQDMKGDEEAGSRTLALTLGLNKMKYLIAGLTFFSLGFLAVIFLVYLPDWISLIYFIIFLAIPFLYVALRALQVKTSADFGSMSFMIKLIMFFGILYAPISYFILQSMII